MEVKGIIKMRTNSQSGTSQRTGNQWRVDEYLVVIPGQYSVLNKNKAPVPGEPGLCCGFGNEPEYVP